MYNVLKLKAIDEEDLRICSTYLQDSICPVSSMEFEDNCFSILANRFCWEVTDQTIRVHCGVLFHGVKSVQKRNFHQKGHERVLNLLMISYESSDQSIRLLFSGDREIRLECDSICLYLKDFDHPWPAKRKPMHDVA
jgi:hypothetical protein